MSPLAERALFIAFFPLEKAFHSMNSGNKAFVGS